MNRLKRTIPGCAIRAAALLSLVLDVTFAQQAVESETPSQPVAEEGNSGGDESAQPNRPQSTTPAEPAKGSEPKEGAPTASDPTADVEGPRSANQEELSNEVDDAGNAETPRPREHADAADPGAEAEPTEGEVEDPYEGLDHTGTPQSPSEESDDPEGEWNERYDGRRKKTRAEDTLIWIPRAPLYPIHLVLNYGVRWPIVSGVAKAEEARLFHRIQDVFTFDDGKGGYYPMAFYDKGRGLWGGAHFYYHDLGRRGHSIHATAGGGTNGWILGKLTDSWTVLDDQSGILAFEAMYLRAPNLTFTGLGPQTDIEDEVFFTQEELVAAVSLDVAFADLNRFYMALQYRHARLLDTGREPELGDSDFAPLSEELTGFDDWIDWATAEMRLELDTRDAEREFTSGSGLRWESWGSYNIGMADDVLSYFRYGLEPSVLWDITGVNHVLAFSVTAEALSKTAGDDPPLSETVSLGGADSMQAFLPGRFRGESALVYGVAYSWPVLAFADALLFTDLGTAYRGLYDDFSHDKMALSWGTGARTSFSRNFGFEVLVAWGSNRMELWDDEFTVDNVRFLVGVGRGIGK